MGSLSFCLYSFGHGFIISHKDGKDALNAAGIDIGSRKVFVGLEGAPVRSFETFTGDLVALKDYLLEHGVSTVAMEATGVYWYVLYDVLLDGGLDVWLVDGRQTCQLPGRKTDIKDCQWIQQLHSYGLLNRCFVSEGLIKELRSYQRLREDHLRSAAMHVQHMQKALIEMNIRLPEVLSQVHGVSGMALIKAILSGERNVEKLVSLCHVSIRENKGEELRKALSGHYTAPGLFALKAYEFYQVQISDCDPQIDSTLQKINKDKTLPPGTPAGKRKPIRHNKPHINGLGDHLLKIFGGRDATKLPGFTDYNWLQLYAEIGSDLSKWPSEKHFTSWLGLSPGQDRSGKKNKSKSKGKPIVGQIFKQMAYGLLNSKHIGWGAFARRLRGRKGPAIAIKATARKLATQYWRLIVKGTEFVEKGMQAYENLLNQQKKKRLEKLALELNVSIVPA